MKNVCTLYLIRHGETSWNVKRLIQGHRDIPLNEKGKVQARKLAAELKGIHFDAIYSSDLKRASQTAELIGRQHRLPVTVSRALRERDFGKFSGEAYKSNKNLDRFIRELKKKSKTKEIESDDDLMARFTGFLRKVTSVNLGKTVLVVSHAGPMRTFLVRLKWGTYENLTEGCISNLAYIKLQSKGKNFTVTETFGITKIG